ncbi:hypothetical protein NL108_006734 [Boleophthalmus pectinirostris]|uniref:rho GTPase-activating protein 22-like n=1 Tax=Boleophthalmus pectinirostris TaxID=150288 RepID=UPI000A1C5500|nr:rho GTPase-activating protein 22-like [Boleophthalmus pectinirostris]KAJ0049986.1 hypothetical protein NL108_006734 [Boleophthalmus pectinirostris]
MELHCLPVQTPTGSSCSTDPIYDNCLPHAQSRSTRDAHMEHRAQQPTVPGPCGPRPGLVPAVALGPTVTGARGPGLWPDHSYCSWRGALGLPGYGGELGDRGGDSDQGILWRAQDRAPLKRSPSPSQSTEHRSALSFYDNIPEAITPNNLPVFSMETQEHMYQAWAPQQVQGPPEPEEESLERSPWSSCEIVLPESKDLELISEQEAEVCSQVCQTEPWPSEAPVRIPPPVPVADPSASALRSVLTSLQQQITRQRDEYEERITSLEQRNEELQVEVIRLKTNLAQQRHWYQIVQAKIIESEKARTAAEQRNAALQREMEQFFDTFGELNKEAKKTENIAKSF